GFTWTRFLSQSGLVPTTTFVRADGCSLRKVPEEPMDNARVVRVHFIDADSGACFAHVEAPTDELPDSFESQTTVHMNGQDWEVVEASPMTRAEFEMRGDLSLTLRRVQIAGDFPLDDVLYSLPTICDSVPAVVEGTRKLGK